MKPSDIFALPSLSVHPWVHVGAERLFDVFKVSNIDLEKCHPNDEPDDTIVFKEKLSCPISEGDSVGVTVVEFDQVPFAILNTRSRQPVTCFITDEDIMKEATHYLVDRQLRDTRRLVVGTFFDVPALTEFRDAVLISVGNSTRLVKRAHMSTAGDRLIFDEKAYLRAMGWLSIHKPPADRKLTDPRIAELVYTAILEAIPKDIERVRLDAALNWIGVRATWNGIDYQIGVPNWTAKYAHIDTGYRVSIFALNDGQAVA